MVRTSQAEVLIEGIIFAPVVFTNDVMMIVLHV